MKHFFVILILSFFLTSCTNYKEYETGEIKILQLLKHTFVESAKPQILFNTRKVITRDQIDKAKVQVLFVQLANGQNGTLTTYPGQGIGQTWLGADGTTITLENGVLKATRGMKSDIMGGKTLMPAWRKIEKLKKYKRYLSYLTGNNQIQLLEFKCQIKNTGAPVYVEIFDVSFETNHYIETCRSSNLHITNTYYVDTSHIVRKSQQYHSEALGYITTERLDRLPL